MAQISHIYPPYIDSLDKPDFLFTSFAHHWFTSHFGIPLGTLPGSGNYLFSPRKFSSVPLSQHYACAMTFNMASGQGPGYWDNIMDPVGTRSWTRSWTRLKIDDEDISLLYKHFFKHSLLVHES